MAVSSTSWKKGHAGRPAGVPNKVTQEIRELARNLVDDEQYRERLKERLLAGEADRIEVLLWHYAYGVPKSEIELSTANGPIHLITQLLHERPIADIRAELAALTAEEAGE